MPDSASPGRMAIVQIITREYRKLSPKRPRFRILATFGDERRLKSDRSIEHAYTNYLVN
jgi:hypothetical protein